MIRYLVILILVALGLQPIWGQSGASLKGKVLDVAAGNEPVMFANVKILKSGEMIAGGATDFDGNYNISNIPPGTYDVEITHIEYPVLLVKGIQLNSGAAKTQNFKYEEKGVSLGIIEIIDEKPIVQQDNPSSERIFTAEDFAKMATRDPNDVKAQKSGVVQKDLGQATHTAGSRASSDDIYIDGVRQIGNSALPETEIEQMQIITSGIPAEYGDVTGAITNITTKGPSNQFTGSAQVETSQFLDAFGSNRVDLSVSGPILKTPIKDKNGDVVKDGDKVKMRTLLGYRLAATFNTTKDGSPSAIGSYKLKDDVLARLQADPLVLDNTGGRIAASDYLTANDIESVDARPNVRESYTIINARLDYKPTNDIFVAAGFQGQFNWGKSGGAANRLFNYEDNTQYKQSTLRGNIRLRHTISSTVYNGAEEGDSTKGQPVFQNLSYEIQADYTAINAESYDPRYGDRLFEYGYIGKINRSLVPVVGEVARIPVVNTAGDTIGYNQQTGHAAYNIQFNGYEAATNINPVLSAYNKLIDLNTITSMEQLEIINGRFTATRQNVFGLFSNLGYTGAGYGKSLSTQVRGNVKVNFDLVHGKKEPIRHYMQVGGTYEQRIERSYSISPFSLWTLADQSANDHLDYSADRSGSSIGTFYDANTNRYYDQYSTLIRTDEEGNRVSMTAFGENLRQQLGLSANDWVNVHELSPSQLNISMFEPTTLIQGRQRVLDYYGYDYLGNVSGNNIEFNDFFTEKDANGRNTRPIAPFKPIYVAGYIQDKFTYRDIIVRAGVRIESYDVNTKVLKDPYSIAGYFTASEFENPSSRYNAPADADYTRPSNIGDDFVVYVSENTPEASVVGYRSGMQWYNANGTPVNNARELGANFVPALREFSTAYNDPQGENYDPDQAFTDYKPKPIIMPRLSFAFPIIKDVSSFYANYDVLAQRPAGQNFATPLTYYNFRELASTSYLPNANLKSQRVVNYEIAYEQALNKYSRFKLALLYREERNLIQMKQYFFAYPVQYSSFANDDFSTTKQFMVEYELRPKKRNKDALNAQPGNLRLNFAYTLQFAEGTGSSPTTSAMIAATDLKYIFPLDFDQRHTFNVNIDYRFDKNTQNKVLRNMGLNLNFVTFSGSPYTKKAIPGGIGSSYSAAVTEGSINGANMPWSYRVDLRIDRDFVFGGKEKGEGSTKSKEFRMNIYVRVQNLLNTKNILDVYPATGSASDDGFLTLQSSPGLGLLDLYSSAYPVLYNLRMNNAANYSLPRRIFLGAIFSF